MLWLKKKVNSAVFKVSMLNGYLAGAAAYPSRQLHEVLWMLRCTSISED